MRNVTIKRNKSFVGCLAKMKIYIEDPTTNELTINNVPCRKVGELKNGGEITFAVSEQATKFFVIADNFSKNYCNEYYPLPDGQEDVFLSGQNRYNPSAGNAFRFDGNESEEVVASRKRATRRGLLITIIAVLVGAAIGFLSNYNLFFEPAPEEKTFSSNGMSITLTNQFTEVAVESYTVAYNSKNIAIFALKEDFSLAEGFGDNSLEQYANLLLQTGQVTAPEIKSKDGLVWFEYNFENTDVQKTYHYFVYVYKANDAFWTVNFAMEDADVALYADDVVNWAKSVTFAN